MLYLTLLNDSEFDESLYLLASPSLYFENRFCMDILFLSLMKLRELRMSENETFCLFLIYGGLVLFYDCFTKLFEICSSSMDIMVFVQDSCRFHYNVYLVSDSLVSKL